jgi:hypothetical protein
MKKKQIAHIILGIVILVLAIVLLVSPPLIDPNSNQGKFLQMLIIVVIGMIGLALALYHVIMASGED